jgi:outer membrane protein TolC
LQLGDVRGQVEEDVRLALVTARTSTEQVRAAEATQRLAERELQLARDRFQAGVADNVEVISAQTALENARATHVAALAAYNVARVNLAAALGQADTFRF